MAKPTDKPDETPAMPLVHVPETPTNDPPPKAGHGDGSLNGDGRGGDKSNPDWRYPPR